MGMMKNMCKWFTVLFLVIMLEIFMVVPAYASEDTGTSAEVTKAADVTDTIAVTQAPTKKELDLKGKYHAALGIQTCTLLWMNRFGYYDAGINTQFNTNQYNVLFSGSKTSDNYLEHKGTFTDAVIEGNGTYTVSLKGADLSDETSVSQLHVATDIPVNNKIKFSNVAIKINGNTLTTFDEAYMETEQKYLAGGMVVLAINHWRKPLEDMIISKGLTLSDNGGVECLTGSGDDNVEITFTVSGFAYDKVEAAVSTAPSPATTDNTASVASDEKASNSSKTTLVIIIIAAVAIAAVVVIAVVVRKKKR